MKVKIKYVFFYSLNYVFYFADKIKIMYSIATKVLAYFGTYPLTQPHKV